MTNFGGRKMLAEIVKHCCGDCQECEVDMLCRAVREEKYERRERN